MVRAIIFNKPYGVLSSFTDPVGRPTLKEYIPVAGIYSAGRLDMDSEGLLLLTDDGSLINRLTDPRHFHPKSYLVQIEGVISEEALNQLRQGVKIHGYQTLPAEVEPVPDPEVPERTKPITPHGPTAWLKIILVEGKKRQIRHMTARVGLPTLRLIRVSIGQIGLGSLKPGEWRELSTEEIAQVMGTAARKQFRKDNTRRTITR